MRPIVTGKNYQRVISKSDFEACDDLPNFPIKSTDHPGEGCVGLTLLRSVDGAPYIQEIFPDRAVSLIGDC